MAGLLKPRLRARNVENNHTNFRTLHYTVNPSLFLVALSQGSLPRRLVSLTGKSHVSHAPRVNQAIVT